MGNLRQSMTDEEWKTMEAVIDSKKTKNKNNNMQDGKLKDMDMNQEQPNNNEQVLRAAEPRVEYKTFYGTTFFELDGKVTDALNDGWQPAGPQYQAKGGATDGWFLQSMVRIPRQMMAPRQ